MNSSTWLPVSAHECALSASIEAEPVSRATTVLETAMARLAKKATITVVVVSPPDPVPSPRGCCVAASVMAPRFSAGQRVRPGVITPPTSSRTGRGGWRASPTIAEDRPMSEHDANEDELDEAVERIIELGKPRLHRSFGMQVLTGAVGGGELGFGVLALLVVEERTGSTLLGALAFSVGFLALQLGHSELFTEGFLVPVTTVAAKEGTVGQLLNLWAGTFVGNLVGGVVAMGLIVLGFPELHQIMNDLGAELGESPLDVHSLALAVLAGAAITLMTRMHNGTDDDVAKVVATVAIAFVVAGTGVLHSVLDSLLIFGSLLTGSASIGFGTWLGFIWWCVLGNMAGGLLLVTATRLVRSQDRIKRKADEGNP